MVLATILSCVLNATIYAPENAADAWNDLFVQIEGVEIPQTTQSEWTVIEKEQYKLLLPLIKQINEIAKMPTCDWGLDYSQGLEMELPHLGDIRQAAQLMAFSIQGDAEIGNYASALQGMESLIGISQQATDGRTIITSLVSYSIFAMDKKTTFVIDSSEDVDQLDSLQSVISLLNQFDPFGIRSSVAGEQEIVSDWLLETDLSAVDLEGNFDSDDLEAIRDDENLDIQMQVSSYNEAMDQMVEVFAMPDEKEALEKLSELQEAVELGEYGFLTKLLFVEGNNLLKTAFEASKDVREMQALLQQRIETLRAPRASAYFLEAVNVYCAIDTKERIEATEKGEFIYVGDPNSISYFVHVSPKLEKTETSYDGEIDIYFSTPENITKFFGYLPFNDVVNHTETGFSSEDGRLALTGDECHVIDDTCWDVLIKNRAHRARFYNNP